MCSINNTVLPQVIALDPTGWCSAVRELVQWVCIHLFLWMCGHIFVLCLTVWIFWLVLRIPKLQRAIWGLKSGIYLLCVNIDNSCVTCVIVHTVELSNLCMFGRFERLATGRLEPNHSWLTIYSLWTSTFAEHYKCWDNSREPSNINISGRYVDADS